MKAIVCSKYGPIDEVLSIREVEKPVPGDGDVLVKILASSVNYNSLFQVQGFGLMRTLKMKFSNQPAHIPGNDIARAVEAVGRSVTRFKAVMRSSRIPSQPAWALLPNISSFRRTCWLLTR